jgi:hypothetical protein
MARAESMSWINDVAFFEASLREAPQDEDVDVLHKRSGGGSPSGRSNPSLILRRSGKARASKDPPSHVQEAVFTMPPPRERPVFDLPLSASRWRWRGA